MQQRPRGISSASSHGSATVPLHRTNSRVTAPSAMQRKDTASLRSRSPPESGLQKKASMAAFRPPSRVFAEKGTLGEKVNHERAKTPIALSESALSLAISKGPKRPAGSIMRGGSPPIGDRSKSVMSLNEQSLSMSRGGLPKQASFSPESFQRGHNTRAMSLKQLNKNKRKKKHNPEEEGFLTTSEDLDQQRFEFARSSFAIHTAKNVDDSVLHQAAKARHNPNVVQFPRVLYGSVSGSPGVRVNSVSSTDLGRSSSITSCDLQRLDAHGDAKMGAVFNPQNMNRPRTVKEIREEVQRRKELLRYVKKQRMGQTHLVHLDEEDREHLSGKEKMLRQQEYGRIVSKYRTEILQSATVHHVHETKPNDQIGTQEGGPVRDKDGNIALWGDEHHVGDNPADNLRGLMHKPEHHPSVSSRRVQKKLPVLDFSYMKVEDIHDFLATTPRTGKKHLTQAERVELEKRRERLRRLRQGGQALDFGDGDNRNTNIVVVKQGDTTYAYDQNAAGSSKAARRLSLMMKEDERLEMLRLTGGPNRSYEAHHMNLSNNRITKIDKTFVTVLSKLLTLNIVALDLSFNNISTINENAFSGMLSEASDGEALQGLFANVGTMFKEELLNHNAVAQKVLASRKKALEDGNNASRVLASLTKLHLHGNNLNSIHEVFKLKPLANQLQFLTLHGNRNVDEWLTVGRNKSILLNNFPALVSLNFTTLTPNDAE